VGYKLVIFCDMSRMRRAGVLVLLLTSKILSRYLEELVSTSFIHLVWPVASRGAFNGSFKLQSLLRINASDPGDSATNNCAAS
jgi:hypothetical protein